jgi:ABC-type amino acid transport substrate-binding protein
MRLRDEAYFRDSRSAKLKANSHAVPEIEGGRKMKKMVVGVWLVGAVICGALAQMVSSVALADQLDDIQKSGKLRCGIMLDFPPAGYRDANNNPVGYDVDYCQDMAKALGVSAEVVETQSSDRIPALLSNRVDVSISSATITLERAKVVAFSIPYIIYEDAVLVRKDSGIKSFNDLKGQAVGIIRGSSPEAFFLPYFKKWNDSSGSYTAYASNGEVFLALAQGKIQATIDATTVLGQFIQTPQGQDFTICCSTPFPQDWTGIMVQRNEQGFLNWINVFIWQQVKTGRTQELYKKYLGTDAPPLELPNVYW